MPQSLDKAESIDLYHGLTEQEKQEAKANLIGFFEVLYRVDERIKSEGKRDD